MSTVHVVPLGDLVEHIVPGGLDGHDTDCTASYGKRWLTLEADPDAPDHECPCGPSSEVAPNPDGPDGWLVVHHSLDGREAQEQREEAAAPATAARLDDATDARRETE